MTRDEPVTVYEDFVHKSKSLRVAARCLVQHPYRGAEDVSPIHSAGRSALTGE